MSDQASLLKMHSINFLYLTILLSGTFRAKPFPALKCGGQQELFSTSSLAGYKFFLLVYKVSPFKITMLLGRALEATEHTRGCVYLQGPSCGSVQVCL